MKRPLKCPTCRKEGNWLEGPYAPFCSRRCKLVDLGKWLGEEHVISSELRPDHFEEIPELSAENDSPDQDGPSSLRRRGHGGMR